MSNYNRKIMEYKELYNYLLESNIILFYYKEHVYKSCKSIDIGYYSQLSDRKRSACKQLRIMSRDKEVILRIIRNTL